MDIEIGPLDQETTNSLTDVITPRQINEVYTKLTMKVDGKEYFIEPFRTKLHDTDNPSWTFQFKLTPKE